MEDVRKTTRQVSKLAYTLITQTWDNERNLGQVNAHIKVRIKYIYIERLQGGSQRKLVYFQFHVLKTGFGISWKNKR